MARLFIVEDSELLRARIARDVCALGGFELIGTATGEDEALASITSLCPCVVVTDIGLAEGSGVEVVRRVHRAQCAPVPRVFVLTNYADLVYRQLCLKFGAEKFFDKSTEYKDFLSAMQKISTPS